MSGATGHFSGASECVETTDSLGRILTVKPPNALDQLRLFKAVGPVLAQNQPYLGMAMVAWSVVALDGVPIPQPNNEHQIESLVTRLGDEGMRAAGAMLEPEPGHAEMRDLAGN